MKKCQAVVHIVSVDNTFGSYSRNCCTSELSVLDQIV